jgi:DNA-binding response OmpR family regulator
MQVLILEYDAILRDLLCLGLKRNGFVPILCADPSNVRDEITMHAPEAMIVDNHLPFSNGIDLIYELENEHLLDNVYTVFLSSLGFTSIVKQAIKAGADDFLVKPFDMDCLSLKLKSHQKMERN